MRDSRIDKLAQVLVDYSVEVATGDLVLINGTSMASPLLESLYRLSLQRGGMPHLQMELPGAEEFFMRHASEEQLRFVSPLIELAVDRYTKFIRLMSATNTRSMTSLDPSRQAARARATEPLMQRSLQRAAAGELKWVLSIYPTEAYAQEAEMSLDEYETFVFSACLPEPTDPIGYWQRLSAVQEGWVNFLSGKRTMHILALDTDLSLCIEGRPFINCDGKENFPDGEIFTSPIEDSACGTIRFSYPAIYAGREVEDVWLRFENGRVVEANAGKGQGFLEMTLDTDAGARYLGEVAIGTNAGIQRFTRNMLFDEKIGGTCHLALGSSYPESGGKNRSGIHWDMLCDLRQGGEIWVDDELIHKDGRFLFDPSR